MDTKQFTLMTLKIDRDIARKAMTLQECFRMTSDAGIPFVDIMGVKPKAVPEYRAAMESAGVNVACYISRCSFFGKEKAIRATLGRDMAIARDLGASLFIIIPYNQLFDRRKARKMGHDKVLEQLVNGFDIAVKLSKQYNLRACFETTPVNEICLSGTADCRFVLDHVPGLSLVFDTANMLPHGDETMTAYEALKDRIIHVHLKEVALTQEKPLPFEACAADGRRMKAVVFGQGDIPIKELYEKMLHDGYTGLFAIEYQSPSQRACSLSEHKAQLAQYLDYMNNEMVKR